MGAISASLGLGGTVQKMNVPPFVATGWSLEVRIATQDQRVLEFVQRTAMTLSTITIVMEGILILPLFAIQDITIDSEQLQLQ